MEKNSRYFKGLLIVAVAIILLVIYVAQDREDSFNKEIYELEQSNIELEMQNRNLRRDIDSLDSVISQLHTQSATVIQQKIITKYEKDFNYIDSLNATEGFKFFSEWLSEDDHYKNR